jgi:hypothetical protein
MMVAAFYLGLAAVVAGVYALISRDINRAVTQGSPPISLEGGQILNPEAVDSDLAAVIGDSPHGP